MGAIKTSVMIALYIKTARVSNIDHGYFIDCKQLKNTPETYLYQAY